MLCELGVGGFTWASEGIKGFLAEAEISMPIQSLSDRDPASSKAMQRIFTQTTVRFCIWHLKEIVLAYIRTKFPQQGLPNAQDVWANQDFVVPGIQLFEQTCNASTEMGFCSAFNELNEWRPEGERYFENT